MKHRPDVVWKQENAHSTKFSGRGCSRLSKASRREDLEVQEPVLCWDCATFDFHATLASVLSAGHPPKAGQSVVDRVL